MDRDNVNEFTSEERAILKGLIGLVLLLIINYSLKHLITWDDWFGPYYINWFTFFIGSWIGYKTFCQVREIRYALATGGRSFTDDRRKYHRSFDELIEFFNDSEHHMLDNAVFPEGSWKTNEGIIFGDSDGHLVYLPSTAEANIFAVGTPGSGKTTGIVIPTCLRYGGSVLAVDIKGDIYNACHKSRRILRFCPDLNNAPDISAHFNPFSGIQEKCETERKLFLSNIAITLIPDQPGSDGGYFVSTARKMFIGITIYLLSIKPDLTFPENLHAILHHQAPPGISIEHFPNSIFEWVEMINESNITAAVEQVSSLLGNNEKNISGAFDTLCTALTPFSNDLLDVLLAGCDRCISVSSLEKGFDIYLQVSQENLDVYAPLMTMILNSFMSGFTKRPDTSTGIKNRPILILMDEFPQLTFGYGMINSALSTLRSKSVQCMLIAQTVAQMSRKYPQEGWRSLLGNCTYQLCLKSNEELTQRYFSNLIGTRKELKISTSGEMFDKYAARSVTEERTPIMQPEDFGDLGNQLCIYFNGKYIIARKIKYYE